MDLTGCRPKEVLNWPDYEVALAAQLQARLYEETSPDAGGGKP